MLSQTLLWHVCSIHSSPGQVSRAGSWLLESKCCWIDWKDGQKPIPWLSCGHELFPNARVTAIHLENSAWLWCDLCFRERLRERFPTLSHPGQCQLPVAAASCSGLSWNPSCFKYKRVCVFEAPWRAFPRPSNEIPVQPHKRLTWSLAEWFLTCLWFSPLSPWGVT